MYMTTINLSELNYSRLWMREVSPNSLFTTSLSDVHSTIVVERDPATGKLLEFNEVP